jgi:hypothetical protein
MPREIPLSVVIYPHNTVNINCHNEISNCVYVCVHVCVRLYSIIIILDCIPASRTLVVC